MQSMVATSMGGLGVCLARCGMVVEGCFPWGYVLNAWQLVDKLRVSLELSGNYQVCMRSAVAKR